VKYYSTNINQSFLLLDQFNGHDILVEIDNLHRLTLKAQVIEFIDHVIVIIIK